MAPPLEWRDIGVSSTPIEVLLAQPALNPPPGVERHMSTKSQEQQYFVLGAVFCIAIPGIVVVLRVYTKLTIIRKWDAADGMCRTRLQGIKILTVYSLYCPRICTLHEYDILDFVLTIANSHF